MTTPRPDFSFHPERHRATVTLLVFAVALFAIGCAGIGYAIGLSGALTP